jgi:glycerol-3-phosphate dehydrogenase (NAD(P)+)
VSELAIIGGGSWGTALAIVLAPKFHNVRLWVYEADLALRMQISRENDLFLPGACLPGNVFVSSEFGECLEGATIVLGVMPSHLARSIYTRMLPHLHPGMVFVSATKGLENGTLLRITEVIKRTLSTIVNPRVGVISGPTFAREVARGEPTALVVASTDKDLAATIQTAFSGPTFRLYTSSDPVGVEIGGSVKNVIAIGAGVCHGLGLGSNALAALITRGLAEMSRLAIAMGGRPQTLAGLAGLGDLVLTCTGELSRNRMVGVELSRGRTLEEIVGSMRMVAEGIKTTRATVELARQHGVEMPISQQMHAMLHSGVPPREAIRNLMDRSLKEE